MKKFSALTNLGIAISKNLSQTDYAKLLSIADNLATLTTVYELFFGGTTGQVLTKVSDTDGDIAWAGGLPINNNVWCPGYAPTYVDQSNFDIIDHDVTNIFHTTRRLIITDGADTKYGTITSSTSDATGTHITVAMENGDTLSPNISSVCVTGTDTQWSVLPVDFGGVSLNAIATGMIGATSWWVVVGDAGTVRVSSDGGTTWTAITVTGQETTNWSTVAYNPTTQRFVIGSKNLQTIFGSDDCITFTELNAASAINLGTGVQQLASYYGGFLAMGTAESNRNVVASTDNGVTWSTTQTPYDYGRRVAVIDYDGLQFLYYAGRSGIDSVDIFRQGSWNSTMVSLPNAASADLSGIIVLNATISGSIKPLLAFGETGTVLKLASYGAGSITVPTSPFGTSRINDMTFSQEHIRVVAVGADGKIAYSDDAGDTWTLVANGFAPTAIINHVEWSSTDRVFIAIANNGQMARSSTGLT